MDRLRIESITVEIWSRKAGDDYQVSIRARFKGAPVGVTTYHILPTQFAEILQQLNLPSPAQEE